MGVLPDRGQRDPLDTTYPWAQCLGCGRCITTPGTALLENHEQICPYRLCYICLEFGVRDTPCPGCHQGTEAFPDQNPPPIQTTRWNRDLTRECIERRPGPLSRPHFDPLHLPWRPEPTSLTPRGPRPAFLHTSNPTHPSGNEAPSPQDSTNPIARQAKSPAGKHNRAKQP